MRYIAVVLTACAAAHGSNPSAEMWREVECYPDSEDVFGADVGGEPTPVVAWVSNGRTWRQADYVAILDGGDAMITLRESSGYGEACRVFVAK